MPRPPTPIIDNVEKAQLLRFLVLLIDERNVYLPSNCDREKVCRRIFETGKQLIEEIAHYSETPHCCLTFEEKD